jgi:hypothetical protein
MVAKCFKAIATTGKPGTPYGLRIPEMNGAFAVFRLRP